jgi:hypothetical protein
MIDERGSMTGRRLAKKKRRNSKKKTPTALSLRPAQILQEVTQH